MAGFIERRNVTVPGGELSDNYETTRVFFCAPLMMLMNDDDDDDDDDERRAVSYSHTQPSATTGFWDQRSLCFRCN